MHMINNNELIKGRINKNYVVKLKAADIPSDMDPLEWR